MKYNCCRKVFGGSRQEFRRVLINKILLITLMNGKFYYLNFLRPFSDPIPLGRPFGLANPPYSLIYISPIPVFVIIAYHSKVPLPFISEKW
jgi:hypothetical protein